MTNIEKKLNIYFEEWLLGKDNKVTNLDYIFEGAIIFNSDLSRWDTSNVTSMKGAFKSATSFNQPLNNWGTSNVTTMHQMFFCAISFNKDIRVWKVTADTDLKDMFELCPVATNAVVTPAYTYFNQ